MVRLFADMVRYSLQFTIHSILLEPKLKLCNFNNKNKLPLFNEGDTKQSSTDKPGALGLEFGNVGF